MWAILLALCVLVYVVLMITFNKVHRKIFPAGRAPLICGYLPYIGVALDYAKNPCKYVEDMRKIYGDIFTLYVMGTTITLIANPHNVNKVYISPKNFDFHEVGFAIGVDVFDLPQESIHNDETAHKAMSMIVKKLQNVELEEMTQRSKQKLEQLFSTSEYTKEWKQVDMYNWINNITVSIMMAVLLGEEYNPEPVLRTFQPFDKSIPILSAKIPEGAKTEAKQLRRKFMDCFLGKPNEGAIGLIKERYELYSPLYNEQQLSNLLGVMVWASLSNTTNTMFWSLYHFMKQDESVRQQIFDEINQVLPKCEHGKLPDMSYETLASMSKLDAFIDEVLRLHFSTFSGRMTMNDVKFAANDGNTYHMDKRQLTLLVNSHLDEEIFQDPLTFKYDRFQDKTKVFSKDGKPIKLTSALIPFGGGMNLCPGRFIARSEIKLYVIALLVLFDFELPEDQIAEDLRNVNLQVGPPNNSISVKLKLK